MRVTAGQYAKALYELTEGRSDAEISGVLARFVATLSRNGQLKLKNEIADKFAKVFNAKNGIVVAQVRSREKLDSGSVDKLSGFIKHKYQAEKVVIENVVDEKIDGGVVIRVGDEILDASVKGQLKKMRNVLAS